MCASLNQRSNPLTTCHLHQPCVDASEEGPEGAVRGRGLLLEQHAWAPHGPLLSALPLAFDSCFWKLPLQLPLSLQLLVVSLLSSQPLSWGTGA